MIGARGDHSGKGISCKLKSDELHVLAVATMPGFAVVGTTAMHGERLHVRDDTLVMHRPLGERQYQLTVVHFNSTFVQEHNSTVYPDS